MTLSQKDISELIKSDNASLVVFAITPVQDFIAKARKLRDYWTGSVILSYLSFWGIKTVCEELGPDAVIYPSIKDQSLVDTWVRQNQKEGDYKRFFSDDFKSDDTKEIASFPNKFVFICPTDDVLSVCEKVDASIKNKWHEIADIVKKYLKDRTSASQKFDALFESQTEKFWKHSFGSCKVLKIKDKTYFEKILSADKWEDEFSSLKNEQDNYLYGTTHSLAQSILAAGKMKPSLLKNPQNGEKCPLCGDHEVLNDFVLTGKTSAKDYSNAVRDFWDKVREKTNPDFGNNSQTGEKERLCAICAIKRYLPVSIRAKKESILNTVFSGYDTFPSTTEIALCEKLKDISGDERKKIAQQMHDNENELTDFEKKELKLSDRDKYYAFLLMDGDKMGDLINGEILENRITEETHAKISDALNNFARKGVKPAIDEANGRLIYAGGDDVCAIVPLNSVLDAASKISKSYKENFAKLGLKNKTGKEVSISGAIIIAHHKQPLKEVIKDAHAVLDGKAKDGAGRNALAIRLKKRSGGDRDFALKWDAVNEFFDDGTTILDSFKFVLNAVTEQKLGQSLLYKLGELRQIFEPVKTDKEKLLALLKYELKHSGKWEKSTTEETYDEYTKHLAGLCFNMEKAERNCEDWFTPESAIIASFWAKEPESKGGNV